MLKLNGSTDRDGVWSAWIAQGLVALLLMALAPAPNGWFQASGTGIQDTRTVLVIDVSGSMSYPWRGSIKLDAVRSAADQFLNLFENLSRQGGVHRIGVVSFAESAHLDLALTTDYRSVQETLAGLTTANDTNLYAALETAVKAVAENAQPGEARSLVLVIDGRTNSGPGTAEIFNGPLAEAAKQGVCIYTIGFGEQAELDEEFLRQAAAVTGCGAYSYAGDGFELELAFIKTHHQINGNLLAQFTGDVQPGETPPTNPFSVPDGQGALEISLAWRGSSANLVLRDPDGNFFDTESPNVVSRRFADLYHFSIQGIKPGNWQISMFADQALTGVQPYEIIISSRAAPVAPSPLPPTATPTALPSRPPVSSGAQGGMGGLLIVPLLACAGAVMLIFLLRSRRRKPFGAVGSTSSAQANLRFLQGGRAGQVWPVGAEALSIGQGPANRLQLSDPAAARLHATIRYAQGSWFLQDQGSGAGTYVNGQPITAVVLRDGDRIRIGGTEMVFRIGG
ncbi:MAG: FHA domain-containing protein [Chloroflexota bacterium]